MGADHARDGRWNDLIVFCAGTSWDGNRLPDHHIAERLVAFAPVLYVDPPVSRFSHLNAPYLRDSISEPPLRMIAPGLARLTPRAFPGHSRPGMHRLTSWLRRRAIRKAVGTLDATVRCIVTASLDDVFDAVPGVPRVLYGTDDYVSGAAQMGLPTGRIRRFERERLAQADLVVTMSPGLQEKWEAMGYPSTMIPNGCDAAAFAAVDEASLPDDVTLPRPIVGLVGHVSDRMDPALLEAVAARGHSVLLVGPTQESFVAGPLARLCALPNVQSVGAKPFAALPSYYRMIDVGIVPYADDEFNRRSFPLKTLEYLAAGLPAVSTDLPAGRWLATDLVTLASTPEEFADGVDAALLNPGSSEVVARRRAFAAQHSWDLRARQFAGALGIDAVAR